MTLLISWSSNKSTPSSDSPGIAGSYRLILQTEQDGSPFLLDRDLRIDIVFQVGDFRLEPITAYSYDIATEGLLIDGSSAKPETAALFANDGVTVDGSAAETPGKNKSSYGLAFFFDRHFHRSG